MCGLDSAPVKWVAINENWYKNRTPQNDDLRVCMTREGEIDSIIIDTTTRIFRDLCDPQTINNAVDESWKQPLWRTLEESGLTLCWVPGDKAGACASVAVGFDVLQLSGRFAVPVALDESDDSGLRVVRAGQGRQRDENDGDDLYEEVGEPHSSYRSN